MTYMTGIELAQELQKINHPLKVVILTTFARGGYLRRAMAAYLLKDAPSDLLADVVRKIHADKVIVAPELVTEGWAADDPLGDNERKYYAFH